MKVRVAHKDVDYSEREYGQVSAEKRVGEVSAQQRSSLRREKTL